MIPRTALWTALAALSALPLAAQEPPSARPPGLSVGGGDAGEAEVSVRAQLDRTALWPGDHVFYTLELTCAPGVDLLAEDLDDDELQLSGLQLVGSERTRETGADGKVRYRIRYELTAFSTSEPLEIQERALRYYSRRSGQRSSEPAPAGEVRVPPLHPVLRSVLPDRLTDARLRDAPEPPARSAFLRWSRPVGIGLVLLTIVPVAAWVGGLARTAWRRRASRPRAARSTAREELEELRRADAASEPARLRGYDALDALIRRHLSASVGLDARALTADELRERAATAPEALVDALADCERARYGKPGSLPSEEEFTARLDAVASALERRR